MNEIEKIKSGSQKAITDFYDRYKSPFLVFGRSFGLDKEQLLDVYQDVCVVFIEQVQKGKLVELKGTAKSYLFGIAKHLIFKRFSLKEKVEKATQIWFEENIVQPIEYEETLEKQRMSSAFLNLGNQCKAILNLFYYEEKSLEEVQEILGYSDKNVVKSQKSRCIKKLKELIKNE